jgi:hypothetical protein
MTRILFRRFAVSAGFILIFGLSACGGGDETPAATPPATTPLPPPTTPPPAALPQITVQDTSGLENSGELTFVISLSAPSADTVSMNYETLDGSATHTTDYQETEGELTFTPGETSQIIQITITNDSEPETSESLHLLLSDPQHATLADDTGVGTILDDDAMEQASDFIPNWGTAGVFSDAETCAACHRASNDQDPTISTVMRYPLQDNGEDISPATQWRHSIMAHAFNDPYYQAKVQEETQIFPELAGFIEDKCLTCHSPMGRTNAHHTETGLTEDASCLLDNGCYRLDTAGEDMPAREGVSCTLCHQMQDIDLGTEDSFSGHYSIADADESNAFTVYGPYQNPLTGPMQNNSAYTPQFGNHMTGSALCASCHTLYTPTLEVETGTPTGNNFLEQGPYLEWQNSIYTTGSNHEQQCQDCHMTDPEPGVYATRISLMPNGTVNENWPERSPFTTHSMVGGNTHMLELLRDYRDVLGIENSTTVTGFDEKIAQTRNLLQNKTAALAISSIAIDNDQLNVDVRVTNNTGHKLPTGYPSRRIWLQLTIKNASNQVIFESGTPDANGRISTDAKRLDPACLAIEKPQGFDSSNCYEPHRDVITDPSQIAIYETVLGDTNANITHVLLHADTYLKENRIPPQGFTNSQADAIETQTLPAGVNGDADFNAINNQEGSGSDTVHYRVAVAGQTGPYTVEAMLHYQAIQPSFVNSLHADAGKVNRFKVMYAENPPLVETLASASAETN